MQNGDQVTPPAGAQRIERGASELGLLSHVCPR
jgi:hypothetical protein